MVWTAKRCTCSSHGATLLNSLTFIATRNRTCTCRYLLIPLESTSHIHRPNKITISLSFRVALRSYRLCSLCPKPATKGASLGLCSLFFANLQFPCAARHGNPIPAPLAPFPRVICPAIYLPGALRGIYTEARPPPENAVPWIPRRHHFYSCLCT